MTNSLYPNRTCEDCNRVYKNKSSYCTHKKKGDKSNSVCEREQQKIEINNSLNATVTQPTTINGDHNNTNITPINIIIQNSLSTEEIKAKIEEVLNTSELKELKKLLNQNNITDGLQTFNHLHKAAYTMKDMKDALLETIPNDLLDDKLFALLKKSTDKSATYPLYILFKKIFLLFIRAPFH